MARPLNPGGQRFTSETGKAAAQMHADRIKNDPEYRAHHAQRVAEAMPNNMGKTLYECAVCDRLFWTWVAKGKRRYTCGERECLIEMKRMIGREGGKPAHKINQ